MPGFESGGGGSLTGAHGFAEQYRLRWGVETAYSNYESLRPRTTSRNESVRMLLLLFFPIFIYNAWALVRHLLRTSCPGTHMTLIKMLRLFLMFMKELGLAESPT